MATTRSMSSTTSSSPLVEPDGSDVAAITKADKDMPVILSLIPNLHEVEFHIWDRALKQVSFRYGWPDFILDLNADIPDPSMLSAKDTCDIKNAYVAITNKVNGHAVCDSLDDIELGDARAVYKAVHDHFFRPTTAGRQAAAKKLYSMSMANTDTNLAQFMALITRNAKVVRHNGTPVDDDTLILTVFGRVTGTKKRQQCQSGCRKSRAVLSPGIRAAATTFAPAMIKTPTTVSQLMPRQPNQSPVESVIELGFRKRDAPLRASIQATASE